MHYHKRLQVEALEDRRMLAGVAEGQLFLYLLNEARHDPAAYQRNENLTIDLSAVAQRPPLAVSSQLQAAAQFHSEEMANHNYFAHRSAVTGQWPNANARVHGYELPSWWESDNNYIESIAGGTLTNNAKVALRQLIQSPPHRDHLLGISEFNSNNTEGGVGFASNATASLTNYWTAQLARTEPSKTFLTGVVFDDLNDNGRYDLNEGIAGTQITVGNLSTLSNSAGGWAIAVAPNTTYQVSVGTQQGTLQTSVAVQTLNREVDVRTDSGTVAVDFGPWMASVDVAPPTATLTANNLQLRHQTSHPIVVTYQDNVGVERASLLTGNIRITGPNGYDRVSPLIAAQSVGSGWSVRYDVLPLGATWTSADNGKYSVHLVANQVTDTSGNPAVATVLGELSIEVSSVVIAEDSNDDGIVSPIDVLTVINHLNLAAANQQIPEYFRLLDTNRDQFISAIDVLFVVNYLNLQPAGEGESSQPFVPDNADLLQFDLDLLATEKKRLSGFLKPEASPLQRCNR
jgi:hypothetical protein